MLVDSYEQEDETVIESSEELDDVVGTVKYDISSYGVDFDVEGLCRRLRREEIFVPAFQRNYVWSLREASRFIESLLLGLPVPGIFLARDESTGKLLVIDGQQRLKSLLFFCDGFFDPHNRGGNSREFKLVGVQEEFDSLTYATLLEKDRIDLDNSVIHATVVKQDFPQGNDTSIFHIFERLNSGGRRLYPQEMRNALYPGALIDVTRELNNHPSWRNIYGRKSQRLRDQELILRFLALLFSERPYFRPLQEFLTKFVISKRNPESDVLDLYRSTFTQVADLWWESLGRRAFRRGFALNAAVFDSMFVGLAKRIAEYGPPVAESIADAYIDLLEDEDYLHAIIQSTAEETSVATRIEMATSRLAEL